MRPRRQTLARAIAVAPLAALLAACGGDTSTLLVPRTPSLSDAQISRDVAATAGDAVAGDVADLLAGEAAAGLTSAAASSCPFDAASSFHVCPTVTVGGLSLTRRFQFRDASGTPSQSYDPSRTASVQFLRTLDGTVSGTGSEGVTWTRGLHETSDRTVSGMAGDETQRVWNGSSSGADTTVYTGPATSRTYAAQVTQTMRDVVVAVPRTAASWPLSGTVTRAITARLTQGSTTAVRSVSRTVTVTFNGTSSVPIDVNGVGCTLNLATRAISGCP